MAITYIGANNAAGQNAGTTTTATATPITPTLPSGAAAGDRIFVFECGLNPSDTTPTDWNVVGTKNTAVGTGGAALGSGLRRVTWYYRDYDGVWSMPTFNLQSFSQNSHWIGAIAIRKTDGATWDTPTISTVGGTFNTAATAYTDTSAASFTTHAGGFLMIGTGCNDNVTSTGGALTQSGATFGTVTERCDGGTATGNDVSGKLHTTTVTTGASATTTFTLTLSAASQGETLIVEQTETFPKIETLTDDFNAGINSPWGASGGSVTSESGAVRISHSAAAGDYQYINTAATGTYFNLEDSAALVEIQSYGNQALATHQVSYALVSEGTGSGYESLQFFANNGNLSAYYRLAGDDPVQVSGASITLDTAAHRWLRIRESGGTTYWDTAPDGVAWTNRFSVATPTSFARVYVEIMCGEDAADGASSALIDNFNTPSTGEPVPTAFTGSGTLTATATKVEVGEAAPAFSAAGTLTATDSQKYAVTATLAGSGSLSATVTASYSRTAALTGTGTLTATAIQQYTVAAALTGTGALTATVNPKYAVTTALSGSGALTVATGTVATPAFVGSGTLTATIVQVFASAAALSATGALTATGIGTGGIAAAYTATGTLDAAVTAIVRIAPAFTATGALTAVVEQVIAEMIAYPDAIILVKAETWALTVKAETPTATVKAEISTLTVATEVPTVTVKPENAALTAAAEKEAILV